MILNQKTTIKKEINPINTSSAHTHISTHAMTTSTIKRHTAAEAPPSRVVVDDAAAAAVASAVAGSVVSAETSSSGVTIGKRDSEDSAWSSTGYNYINPFVHKLKINNRMEIAKIYVLTVLLLPIRVVGCFISLISAWMFACIGLYGLTQDDLKTRPITGWRKNVQNIVHGAMRLFYVFGSFHYISTKGKVSTPKEAPILVVAPHSSYVDSILVVATGPPSIVAKRETSEIPFLGKIINFAQPIYVQREDPNSRQNTIREIVYRARSEDPWPHVIIFAEGTCTNRSALIKFKSGAFYPGVPVQPVLLRYPNKYDTYTWTWDGPGVWRLLWLTFTQFYNRCQIEYLPVYTPSEEEKADANLYARNVRDVMAKALGVPTSEYSFEDVIMMNRARELKVPFPGDIVEIERNLHELGLLKSNRDVDLAAIFTSMSNTDRLDIITFSELLQVDLKNKYLHQLFALLDHHSIGAVSLKSFLLCSFFCKEHNREIIEFLRVVTNIYSESRSKISRTSFGKILKHYGKLTEEKCDAIFFAIDYSNKGYISFDDFEKFCKNSTEYQPLFKEREQIRRLFVEK